MSADFATQIAEAVRAVLEAHTRALRRLDRGTRFIECACGWRSEYWDDDAHRAHVAAVLGRGIAATIIEAYRYGQLTAAPDDLIGEAQAGALAAFTENTQ